MKLNIKKYIRVIAIDDDFINHTICRHVAKAVNSDLEVLTFNIPEIGFEFIQNNYATNDGATLTLLLLDINMPTWSGWDFLDHFEELDEHIKKQIKICILSSSVNLSDRERAAENKNVAAYIQKPLTKDKLIESLK